MESLIKKGDLAGVRRLIESKPGAIDEQQSGLTPLMRASWHGRAEIAEYLISKGAKLDLQNSVGQTALMYASLWGHPDVVHLLISKRARLEKLNTDGRTAIMVACEHASDSADAARMLRCVKLLYAAGADLVKGKTSALEVARAYKRADALAFLEFVTLSDVGKALQGPLKQWRSVAIAFLAYNIVTLDDCKALTSGELEEFGVHDDEERKKILRHFGAAAPATPTPAAPKRASLAQRLSQRLLGKPHAAFLTHDWGGDELGRDNHFRAARVNGALKTAKLATWFDADRLSGNIAQQIAQGIEGSRKVVVFVTERYMTKLMERDGVDHCRDEFLMAVRIAGAQNMIPVVMEPRMLDQRRWRGPLGLRLGEHLYLDFSTDAAMDANLPKLIERIEA